MYILFYNNNNDNNNNNNIELSQLFTVTVTELLRSPEDFSFFLSFFLRNFVVCVTVAKFILPKKRFLEA